MKTIKLRQMAHARAGDKGNTSNICVFPYRDEDYDLILEMLTLDRVKEKFGEIVKGNITRYEAPVLKAFLA